ncbi:MAG: hypothetical protein H6Q74_337 [Firmicutes bacterium]|nr:hypothetical protein [Bacillota bacterium]
MPRKLPKCLEDIDFLPNVSVYIVLKGAIALTGTLIAEISDRHHDEPLVCPPPKIDVNVPPAQVEVNPKIEVNVEPAKVDVGVKVEEEPEFLLVQLSEDLVIPLGIASAIAGSASTTITTAPVATSFTATATPSNYITFESGTIISINIGEILIIGTNGTIA